MSSTVKTILNTRYFLWAVLALPLGWLGNGLRNGDLFYGEIIHVSGQLSARLLLLSLAITPLRLFFSDSNWPNWLLHRRRYFGVAAFVYAILHTGVYLDRKIASGLLLQEAGEFSMWTGLARYDDIGAARDDQQRCSSPAAQTGVEEVAPVGVPGRNSHFYTLDIRGIQFCAGSDAFPDPAGPGDLPYLETQAAHAIIDPLSAAATAANQEIRIHS
ncbi:MAG: hypothetical protein IIA09_19280 [Proteobacteria bacterium]|nr:hypothetical protein [Pseudomonadota bacterium]